MGKKGVITGTEAGMKIRDLKTADIKEGHTYYLGASSEPDLIYMEDIKPEKVTYRQYPFYPEDRLTRERDVTEDLIATGNETVRNSRKSDKYIDRDTNLKEIQVARIKFRVKKSAWNKWDNPYRAVERKYGNKYGLETNHGVGERTFKTTVTKENVSKIRDLPEIRVVESKKYNR